MTHDDHNDEIWRPLPGFVGFYSVSSHGRLMSHHARSKPDRLRNLSHNDGSIRFMACRDKTRTMFLLQDAVMAAFVGPKPDGAVVRFRDGDRGNCRIDNLFYSYRYDPTPIDELPQETKPITKMTAELARQIAACPDRARDVAQRFGVTVGVVTSIRIGRVWRDATEGYRLPSYWKRTNAKLTEADVADILASPDERAIDLAAKYGVSPSVINDIRRGIAWPGVDRASVMET